MTGGHYFTVEDVARRVGRGARWVVRRLISTGELRAYRVGVSWRVRPADFDAWEAGKVAEGARPVLIPVGPGERRRSLAGAV